MWGGIGVHVEVRDQSRGIGFLPPCRTHGLNSGPETCQQAPLLTEPSCCPLKCFFSFLGGGGGNSVTLCYLELVLIFICSSWFFCIELLIVSVFCGVHVEVRDQPGWVSSLHPPFRTQGLVLRFGSKLLSLLSHLAGPECSSYISWPPWLVWFLEDFWVSWFPVVFCNWEAGTICF